MSVVMKTLHARALTMFATVSRISRPRLTDTAGAARIAEMLEANWIRLGEKDHFEITQQQSWSNFSFDLKADGDCLWRLELPTFGAVLSAFEADARRTQQTNSIGRVA